MVRLFTAITLPEPVRAGLVGLRAGIPGARWLDPEQIHLTLRFIGEVDGAGAREALSALADVRAPSFELTLSGVGQFGDKKPHTLWVGVSPSEPLMRLAAKVETALQRAGFAPETRRFTPHITVARLRHASGGRMIEFLSGHSLFRAGPFPVEEFVLFSSQLSRSGTRYRPEAQFPLEPARPQDPGPDARRSGLL